ncbi:hypothetical protein FRC04_000132 [Tulasnella sp. 424]|nr:hypothetical protein FRC04_000132 [Tulasnella sp. 424]
MHGDSVPLHPIHTVYSMPSSTFTSPVIAPASLSIQTSSTHGTKRQSPSSPSQDSNMASSGGQRPTKRSRKAINCEPCRASKLKCDRGRPCSGCILRGTISLCYADGGPVHPSDDKDSDYASRVNPRIDPRAEITRIRNSLLVIENHINRAGPGGGSGGASLASNALLTRSESSSDEGGSGHSRRGSMEVNNVMGSYGSQSISPTSLTSEAGSGGMVLRLPDDPPPGPDSPEKEVETPFIGATSIASSLRILSAFDCEGTGNAGETSAINFQDKGDRNAAAEEALSQQIEQLVSALPRPSSDGSPSSPEVIATASADDLISHYFADCVWAYRAVHRDSFLEAWGTFMTSVENVDMKTRTVKPSGINNNTASKTRQLVTLATGFAIFAVSTLHSGTATQLDQARQYFDYSEQAYSQQHVLPFGTPASLDVLELLLLHVQYLELIGEAEKIWQLRGRLVSLALELGLHRDPGRWSAIGDIERERRREAWWNTLWVERPSSIQNPHFDTTFPSEALSSPSAYSSPYQSPTSIHLHHHTLMSRGQSGHSSRYRLAHLLGSILEDFTAASANLSSERVCTHDKALQRLLDAPEELLMSMDGNGMENKVVAVLNRAALLHVRLVLHRAVVVSSALGGDATRAKSLEVAIRSAETLVHLYIAHSTAATLPTIKLSPSATGPTSSSLPPAYLASLTQHTYDATLFLVSLLINFPLPSVAHSFQPIRQGVRSAFHAFGVVKIAGADRAWKLLGALRPLWEEGGVALERKHRQEVWSRVKKLGGLDGGLLGAVSVQNTYSPKPPVVLPQRRSTAGETGSPDSAASSISELLSRRNALSASPPMSGVQSVMVNMSELPSSSKGDSISLNTPSTISLSGSFAPLIALSAAGSNSLNMPSTTAAGSAFPHPEEYFDLSSYGTTDADAAWSTASLGLYSASTTSCSTSGIGSSPADWAALVSDLGLGKPLSTGDERQARLGTVAYLV